MLLNTRAAPLRANTTMIEIETRKQKIKERDNMKEKIMIGDSKDTGMKSL